MVASKRKRRTIYLDVCCLNRPFDDQRQDRIRLQAEAVLAILRRLEAGEWRGLGSDVVDEEIARTPDPGRGRRVRKVAELMRKHVAIDAGMVRRARALESMGLHAFDALHLACAEAGGADVLLTTDEQFVAAAARHEDRLHTRACNPLVWLNEELER